jgi:hypothetical protein
LVGVTGFEPADKNAERFERQGDTQAAPLNDNAYDNTEAQEPVLEHLQQPADLAAVVDAWPTLPAPIKAAVLSLITSAKATE